MKRALITTILTLSMIFATACGEGDTMDNTTNICLPGASCGSDDTKKDPPKKDPPKKTAPPAVDTDRDKDGILNEKDACPDEPETFNGYMDEDGCPDKAPPTDKCGDGFCTGTEDTKSCAADCVEKCWDDKATCNGLKNSDGKSCWSPAIYDGQIFPLLGCSGPGNCVDHKVNQHCCVAVKADGFTDDKSAYFKQCMGNKDYVPTQP